MAKVFWFMKIDHARGDATFRNYEGWIEVQSFFFGDQSGFSDQQRAITDTSEFHIRKSNDNASVALRNHNVSGEHFPSAIFAAVALNDNGETRGEYLRITFTDVTVSSFEMALNNLEEVSFDYAKRDVHYGKVSP